MFSDSSPLSRIGCFDLLPKLYGKILISTEVYNQVVIRGAGLPGATQAAQADWIEMRPVENTAGLAAVVTRSGLGAGEVSAVFLAKEQSADLVLIDEWKARRYASQEACASSDAWASWKTCTTRNS